MYHQLFDSILITSFSGLEGWICTIQRGKHKNKIEHGGQVCYNYHMISTSDNILEAK